MGVISTLELAPESVLMSTEMANDRRWIGDTLPEAPSGAGAAWLSSPPCMCHKLCISQALVAQPSKHTLALQT